MGFFIGDIVTSVYRFTPWRARCNHFQPMLNSLTEHIHFDNCLSTIWQICPFMNHQNWMYNIIKYIIGRYMMVYEAGRSECLKCI